MPTAARPWRSASLVLVLPAEPVTAMIFARERARAAMPAFSSACSTSGTTIMAVLTRPSAGSLCFGNHQHAGAGRHRRAGEIMAVERFALDGEEGVAGLQRAGVDRDAADALRHLSERPPADGCDQRRSGPQIAHAARSRSASRTSS